MKRISFNPRFINQQGNDLVSGKIHTIRQNYNYWKKFEGQEIALFTWEGKPYRSKQKVFCVKKIVSVQMIYMWIWDEFNRLNIAIEVEDENDYTKTVHLSNKDVAKNDGLLLIDFKEWFKNYKSGKMAIIHFTDFRY